jgi:prephenate dehydratase
MNAAAASPRVAIQGERGAFSEEACHRLLGDRVAVVPRPTFDALFAAVGEGRADALLAPIENSIAGSVHRCYDLLLQSPLTIQAEVILPVQHCLITAPGATLETVMTVESHPVALAQCEGFFRAHPRLRRIAADDTAGSVRAVVEAGDISRAAIAGRLAAQTWGGRVLLEGLEDHPENYTRFLLLRPPGEPVSGANKLSLVFELAHQPGTLHRALAAMAARGANLLKIESRPLEGRPWHYRFYLDVQTTGVGSEVSALVDAMRPCSEQLRVLGWFAAATESRS